MAIRDLSTLGLGELLGSLMSAVIQGQQAATASSLQFVEQVGFRPGEEGEDAVERFRTVTLRYTKLDENQQPAEFVLEIPLLAMVAIPTLTVKQAKLSFKYDITEASAETATEPEDAAEVPPTRLSTLPAFEVRPVLLRGVVTPRSSVTSNTRETAGVDIEVTVESEPLPIGLERIIELTELTVTEPAEDETP
ncbi:MAG: DUF2589 domain-containing protein [Nocardioidaceae bacterium]